MLRTLPGQLRELLEGADPVEDAAMRRLFPAAYLDDTEAAREFDSFVRDDLTAERLRALETMAGTIDEDRLTEEQLLAWLGAINDLRLVLGVRLNVTEESEPQDFTGPDESTFAIYAYLSYLEEEVVGALSA